MKLGGRFTSSGHRVISAKLLKGGRIDLGADEPRYVNSAVYAKWMKGPLLPGDVLMTSEAPLGELAYINANLDWCLGQRLFAIRPRKDRLDGCFAYYALQTRKVREDIIGRSTGTTVQGIRQSELRRVRLPVPELSLQVAAASVLRAIDDRIALLRETNATLEAIAQALFKSWFVDFDPVRAKSQGLAPAGMDEATAGLFPGSFEESASGPLPRGWRALTLAEAFEINPSRSLRKGVEAKYLEMAGVPTSGHCADTISVRAFGSGTKFRNGDTLLARITPCLENGKTAFVDFLEGHEIGWGSTEFIVLRPKAPLSEYTAYLLCRHAPFREFAERSMSGTSGRQRVQNDVLATFRIAVPSPAVAESFGALVCPLQQAITSNHSMAATLGALRDALLPRLISGQLRLPEALAEMEEAA